MLDVLRSGQLSLGPRLPEFEQRFAAWLGAEHACAVSSGTTGLHLALRAVGVSEGDEVITSPFSFVASANAIVYERAKPVFVDIDPRTLNVDRSAVAAAVTDRTSALLPVHIFGYPADIPALERLSLPIVEDACEALGAVHADGPRGRHARASGRVRLLRQQAADDGRGRHDHARRRGAEGAHRLRAQPGPGARHGLARPRPARLQLPARRHRMRPGDRPAAAPRRHAGRPRPRRRLVPRGAGAAGGADRAGAAVRGRGRATSAAGSSSSSRSRRAPTATRSSTRCATAPSPPSPICPRST